MSSFAIEKDLWKANYKHIAGIDEVGRGPIAGHLVTAAVIFPVCVSDEDVLRLEIALRFVDDSKKLTSRKRQFCYRLIHALAIDYSVSSISPQGIDLMGIGKAVTRCMALSVLKLKQSPDFILVDGLKTPQYDDYEHARGILNKRWQKLITGRHIADVNQFTAIRSRAIVKGDSLSLSISAASILAKVTRDRMMTLDALKYPDYGFEFHKGYGTALHLKQLSTLGATPLHRISFSPLSNQTLPFDEE